MKSLEIRQKFFEFFVQRGHIKVASSSLIPAQDPTILFTNAGMNQFKDIFLGKETRSYNKAVSIQKCMRAGGKHNDLDNVGFTARHLTFFEMLGNFSFGAYFKQEAISYAWDFLTKAMPFAAEKLYVTVYEKDDEAYEIWNKRIGVPASRISRLGQADNFWQMGETGPCGPCSEIYVDRGEHFSCGKLHCAPGCSCDRFLEVWNLVFMQYDRQPDGTDKPLAHPGIDTGMGLERLAFLLEQKDSVFQSDVFYHVMRKIESLTNLMYAEQTHALKNAFNVLADHIRSSCFLIADGCQPSNEGRGYVLRKIIRRAALFAKKLTEKNIFPHLAHAVVQDMGAVYPELHEHQNIITKILQQETEKFDTSLNQGQDIFNRYCQESTNKIISGMQAFKLYDTYGFPLEITRILAQEKGFSVDIDGFEQCMEEQRQRSGKKQGGYEVSLPATLKSEFVGYQHLMAESVITALVLDDTLVDHVDAGKACWIISEKSPFYVEKGGQVSDTGWLIIDQKKIQIEALKRIGNTIAIKITAPTMLVLQKPIGQIVDRDARLATMKNHTATHLLQAALIALLGKKVRQAGSLVAPDYLRFDFTFDQTISQQEIQKIEELVNQKIWENIPVCTTVTTYQNAIDHGVMAIFGEKYNPEEVRVVDVAGFSAELCGGTHVQATGDIGCFKITEVSSLSTGQRRIVALTGPKALQLYQDVFAISKQLSQDFKVPFDQIMQAIGKQRELLQSTQQILKQEQRKILMANIPSLLEKTEKIKDLTTGFFVLNDVDMGYLREVAQELVMKKSGFYMIVSHKEDQISYLAVIDGQNASKLNLKKLSAWLKDHFGLHGGGKDTLIQGGGSCQVADLQNQVHTWIMNHYAQ